MFSNYARGNCPADDKQLPTLCAGTGTPAPDSQPKGGPWWSLMFEISESQYKPVEWQSTVEIGGKQWPQVVLDTLQGALNTKLMSEADEVVSIYHRRCAAPPCLLAARTALLAKCAAVLRAP